ncbi:hypothetical protein BKI52_40285 [marine bacterium AO1-C]|nr:hypothetical protein BKI52_40285 [marine bacterium AO1-C]
MKLTNNTILITGGTSGIGWQLGQALLKLGNEVILLGRNSAKLAKAKAEGFHTIQCDLNNQTEIEQAVLRIEQDFPRLNFLFNNAGVQYNYQFTQDIVSSHKIQQEVCTNLTGQLILTQLLIPLLHQADRSFIINTTSGLGAFPKADGLVYSATKAALRNFTQGLRYSLKNTPIKVLEFIPPVTETAMTQGRPEAKMSSDALVTHIIPQLKKERKILTVRKMRLFLWVAFLFPGLAHKILNKS